MPLLFIHAKNFEFQSRDDGSEYDQPEDALASGINSAVLMVADEIRRGDSNAAVEIIIEQGDGRQLLRSIVALSVSPLIVGDVNVVPFPTRK